MSLVVSESREADRPHQDPTVSFVAVLRCSVSLAGGAVFCCGWQSLSMLKTCLTHFPCLVFKGQS